MLPASYKTAPQGKDRGISFLFLYFYVQSCYKVISLWLATDFSLLWVELSSLRKQGNFENTTPIIEKNFLKPFIMYLFRLPLTPSKIKPAESRIQVAAVQAWHLTTLGT